MQSEDYDAILAGFVCENDGSDTLQSIRFHITAISCNGFAIFVGGIVDIVSNAVSNVVDVFTDDRQRWNGFVSPTPPMPGVGYNCAAFTNRFVFCICQISGQDLMVRADTRLWSQSAVSFDEVTSSTPSGNWYRFLPGTVSATQHALFAGGSLNATSHVLREIVYCVLHGKQSINVYLTPIQLMVTFVRSVQTFLLQ